MLTEEKRGEKWRKGITEKTYPTRGGVRIVCPRCSQPVLRVTPKPQFIQVVEEDGHLHWPRCPGRK